LATPCRLQIVFRRNEQDEMVTRRQEFGFDDWYLDLASTDRDELINGEENEWTEHEVVGEGSLDHASGSVKQHQDEVDRIAEVNDPERTERVTTGVLHAEDKDEEEL